jgi:ABC-type nitrate/sulfonate/bicarbonate transport system substrate-binding protein
MTLERSSSVIRMMVASMVLLVACSPAAPTPTAVPAAPTSAPATPAAKPTSPPPAAQPTTAPAAQPTTAGAAPTSAAAPANATNPGPVATSPPTNPNDKMHIVFGGAVTPPSMVHLAPYVAKDLGFFDEVGLDVEIKSFEGGVGALRGGLSGGLDVVATSSLRQSSKVRRSKPSARTRPS